ncbi:MAG: hypothetical protein CMM52_12975 [Rhodospirillaceae bacterium]|nr:hypothetical protein [Rhodospirillaceae bacterium]|tara:strand:- start:25109 stop:26248 length:1140 start_codon:yes stop_codon:yes gene_type:complete
MGQANRKFPELSPKKPEPTPQGSSSHLRDIAVAIDPPPSGAIGIQELLDRMDFLSEANFFSSNNSLELEAIKTTRTPPSWNIYDIADPSQCTAPLDLLGWNTNDIQNLLRRMIRIRIIDAALQGMAKTGKISAVEKRGYESEAVSAGVAFNLNKSDHVLGNRLRTDQVLTNSDRIDLLFASYLKENSVWRVQETKFINGSPYNQEFGTTLANSIYRHDPCSDTGMGVVVCYVNWAEFKTSECQEILIKIRSANYPVLMVCEHVRSSDHLLETDDTTANCAAQHAEEYGIDWAVVDGSDVVSIATATKSLTDRVRKKRGPALLEAVLFSSTANDEKHDPIYRLTNAMITRGDINHAGVEILESLEQQSIKAALTKALSDS